ncbi:PREDICTED: zymogen granule membrane protein 16-like [Poecilia mexicana]|uniref:Jacalin-type lectin domain-containing protein n=1 Tax=Poecilia mexicana TaxID=48701 RepID=A0A3B3YHP5_9TELE|nr:PREDICTED: zymogen granule membrane protein 16-like [Poecilia mexicana]
MHYVAIFALLTACALADDHYSFSKAVGQGGGSSYSIVGDGRITAIRVWEVYNNYIYGFQLCYGVVWTPVVGYVSGEPNELHLYDDERIVQVSGKYAQYIQSLIFVTDKGRSLHVGQPAGTAFNMYPTHPDAELRYLSGRVSGPPTSFQAHWAVLDTDSSETN